LSNPLQRKLSIDQIFNSSFKRKPAVPDLATQHQIIQLLAFSVLAMILVLNIRQQSTPALGPLSLIFLGAVQHILEFSSGEFLIANQVILNNIIIAMLIIAPCYALGLFQGKDSALTLACCPLWTTENYIIMCLVAILTFACLQLLVKSQEILRRQRAKAGFKSRPDFSATPSFSRQISPGSLLSLGCASALLT
jgi:hypothetical protein